MASLSSDTDSPSLSELYKECVQSFKNLLALSEVYSPDVWEEYGRTKIWGDQTKADLPARARGSLDDTLRRDDELKHLVQAILMRLRALLSQALQKAEEKDEPAARSDHDSISSVSTDSDSELDDDSEYQRQSMPKIVQQIREQIRSLYDLSSLLRRPKIADKYIRSVNAKSKTAMLNDSDTIPLSVGFCSSEENHIAEKILQWRGLTKSVWSVPFEDEDVAPVGQGLIRDCVEDILWFCQRLGRANTRRREQLQYWTDHPYDPKGDAINSTRVEFPAKQHIEESQSQTPTPKPPDPNPPREGPRTVVSKQSCSTAAVSVIHDTHTNVRPRTVYAPTAIGQARFNPVPDPPNTANENAIFTCPYCGMKLDSSEMKQRLSWKRHVFHDLRPYICTFENCQNAEKLYVSRHDWIYHELQVHRRKYVCKECPKVYSSRKEMSAHLQEHYGKSISHIQLSVILDLCDRQVDVADNERDSCLVCGEDLSLSALHGHLATHMEDIALFVLPNTDEEEEETGGSRASVQVAKLESKGKPRNAESEASSLGFSATKSHGQTPADFAKAYSSEEVGYASKILSWRTTDESQNYRRQAGLTDLDGPPAVLHGSDIAATALGLMKCNVYFQDTQGVIREYTSDEVPTTTSPTFSAKLLSPLAVISFNSGKEIRVYCTSEDDCLEEWCYSAGQSGWHSGHLTDSRFRVAANTKLAAVYWFKNGPNIRLYAQDPSSDQIQEYCAGNPWTRGSTLPVALKGTSIAAVCWQNPKIHLRVYYQAPDRTLKEHCWDEDWYVGSFATGQMPGRTSIAAVGWYAWSLQLRVYCQDDSRDIVAYKWNEGWSFDGTVIRPLQFRGLSSALEWNFGNELRFYYQARDGTIRELCQSNNEAWCKGFSIGP